MPDQPRKRPDTVIYHADCPDGFAAAWAYWCALGEAATYTPIAYDDPLEAFPDVVGKHVVMVDVSAPRPILEVLAARAASFRLLDHHATAAARLRDCPLARFDLTHSGAWLAWTDIAPAEPMPAMLRYIEDRDLQRFALPATREVTLALDCEPRTFAAWQRFSEKLTATPDVVQAEGRVLRRLLDAAVIRAVRQSVPVRLGGVPARLAMAPRWMAPDTAMALASHPARRQLGLAWCTDASGAAHLSLRSPPHADSVLDLAHALGGGGGPHAAAARLRIEDVARMLAGEDILATRSGHRESPPRNACCE